jgi:alpha-L-rhamnosidase
MLSIERGRFRDSYFPMRIPYPAAVACLFSLCPLFAQSGLPTPAPELLRDKWTSHWITAPTAPRADYAVLLARKAFTLPAKPAKFVVHVSADARYLLKVNGQVVCTGPQWSGQPSWRYESVDLAPWLQAGENVISARVRSYGAGGPLASMGRTLGFILQGDTAAERIVDSGKEWKVLVDASTKPFTDDRGKLHTYFALGPGESHDGNLHSWGWELPGFDDSAWLVPKRTGLGLPKGSGAEDAQWLTPRTTPLMELKPLPPPGVRRSEGVTLSPTFAAGLAPFTVPARSKASVLLDQGHLTNAYPQLTVSGGKGARVRLSYAEALVDAQVKKGNRNEIEGRQLVGMGDEFVTDGGENRRFATDDWRTFRYVEIKVETGDEPLTVQDLHGLFTGYPFVDRGSFASDDPRIAKVWEVGWRTARLCAGETYFDCPYYEQLQYVGDTRIQALISLYVAGDDRLVRNAIELFDRSRIPEGITQSRYPSASAQLIPTFSLFWIDMVHDYWRHRPDAEFVRARLPGAQGVLAWYERHLDPKTGLLGALPYWPFVDWTSDKTWPVDPVLALGGVPPGGREGGSATITLQLAYTLQHAAELYDAYELHDEAAHYAQLAAQLKQAVTAQCWDAGRKLYADTPAKKNFSQHTNVFAVLSGAVQGDAARDLIRRVADDRSLVQASAYFSFYLLRAMKQAGLGDEYVPRLAPWHQAVAEGFTTFPEIFHGARSDCHAWSASPLYELLATVCGIEPASPGFATVRIEPHLGPLQHVEGKAMHPQGEIIAKLQRAGTGVKAEITLPAGVTGKFVWGGKTAPLKAGAQTIELP